MSYKEIMLFIFRFEYKAGLRGLPTIISGNGRVLLTNMYVCMYIFKTKTVSVSIAYSFKTESIHRFYCFTFDKY